MPRIPEDGFRLEPSTRVTGTPRVNIESGSSTQLKKLGGEFSKIATKIEKAEARANSLKKMSIIDDEKYEKEFLQQMKKFFSDSSDGIYKDPTTKVSMDIKEKISLEIDKFDKQAKAQIGNDLDALDMYARYTVPKLNNLKKTAESFQLKAKTNFTNNNLDRAYTDGANSIVSGTVPLEQVIGKAAGIRDRSSDIVGAQTTKNKWQGFLNTVGMSAGKYISKNGATPENIKQARKMVNLLPTSAARETMNKSLDQTILAVQTAETNAAIKNTDKILTDISTFQDMTNMQPFLTNEINVLLRNPLRVGEPVQARVDLIGKALGKQIAFNQLGSADNAGKGFSEYSSQVLAILNSKDFFGERGLASAAKASFLTNEQVVNSALKFANKEIATFLRREQLDYFSVASDRNSILKEKRNSKDSFQLNEVITEISDDFSVKGIAKKNQHFISRDDSKEMLDEIKLINTGQNAWQWSRELKARYFEHSPWALNSAIGFSGSDKKGNTKIPPIYMALDLIDSQSVGQQMMQAFFDMPKDKDIVLAKIKKTTSGFKKDFRIRFNNLEGVSQLLADTDNKHILYGYRQAIEALAINEIKLGNSTTVADAVASAANILQGEFMFAQSNDNAVVVKSNLLDQVDNPATNMNKMVRNLSQLKDFDKLGIIQNVDFVKMGNNFKSAGKVNDANALMAIAKNKTPESQLEAFLDRYEDSIIVRNNPRKPNEAVLYIRGEDRRTVLPLLTKIGVDKNGKDMYDTLSIDMITYAGENFYLDQVRQEEFLKQVEQVGRRGKVEVVPKDNE